MTEELVSIVIPVYNGENYLKEAIESALNQTYKSIEILVVDDGSSDNTRKIMDEYGDRVRSFHKENGGVSSALNLAIKNMNGEWFSWLSHDDLYSPNKISMQIEFMKQHPDADVCYTGYALIDSQGKILPGGNNGICYSENSLAVKKLLLEDYVNGLTPLIPKKCFQEIGLFREDLRCVQDWDMWIRLMMNYNWILLPETLVYSRVHDTQTGVRISPRCDCEKRYLQKYYLKNKNIYSKIYPKFSKGIILNIVSRGFIIYVLGFVRLKKEGVKLISRIVSVRIKQKIRRRIYN